MVGVLPDKTRETYDRLFSMLHDYLETENLNTAWRESVFMTDFELAMRESIKYIFPFVTLMGCFFHYTQVCNSS